MTTFTPHYVYRDGYLQIPCGTATCSNLAYCFCACHRCPYLHIRLDLVEADESEEDGLEYFKSSARRNRYTSSKFPFRSSVFCVTFALACNVLLSVLLA